MFDKNVFENAIKIALSKGGDYCDIFVEEKHITNIRLENSQIKSISAGKIFGAGVRVIYGINYIYVFASDVDEKKLLELAKSVSEALSLGKHGDFEYLNNRESVILHNFSILPENVNLNDKVEILKKADSAARDYSSSIVQVEINYSDLNQKVWIANSEKKFVFEDRIRTRLAVNSIARKGDRIESGFYAPGKALGFEFFNKFKPEDIAKESAIIATVMLEADYAPKGTLPVVIDNEFGGVIFHEACGHALEATSVADNASVFTGKLGEKIANDCVTAIDDGTIPNEWGSNAYDDEGNRTQKNILIENGYLKSYLVDKLGSIKMKVNPNGCGRRESYKYAPTSRMSNTYIAPGKYKLEELISSIDYGLYCKKMGGGSVNPPTTDFNFAVSEAYLIKNGKIDRPVKNASLIGKGSEIIKNIDMVADNLDFGTGMCGSISGSVPANVGQPAIRVQGLVIGGR